MQTNTVSRGTKFKAIRMTAFQRPVAALSGRLAIAADLGHVIVFDEQFPIGWQTLARLLDLSNTAPAPLKLGFHEPDLLLRNHHAPLAGLRDAATDHRGVL